MKKKFIIFFMIVITMLSFCISLSADEIPEAEEKTVTVSLIIEGYKNTIYSNSVEIRYSTESLTLQNVLEMVDVQAADIEIKGLDNGVISDINGESNGMFEGNEKWNVAVNGIVCDTTLEHILLNDKDVISLFFADAPFAYPILDATKARDGILHFYGKKHFYDSSFRVIGSTEENLVGAVVLFDGKEYVTDENGNIDIQRGLGNGTYIYSVSKVKTLSNNEVPAAMRITDAKFIIEDIQEIPNYIAYILITVIVLLLILFGTIILILNNKNNKKRKSKNV